MILELNLGVFIAVVAILGSLWLFGRFLLGNEIAYTPAKKRHNWKSINMLGSVRHVCLKIILIHNTTLFHRVVTVPCAK